MCHSWREPLSDICNSCEVTGRAVGFPVGSPSVITVYTKPSDLRDWLTRYKGRPSDDADPFDQDSFDRVRAILGRYLLEHGTALAERLGPVDAIVTVPSGRGRPLPHPLETVLSSLAVDSPIASMLVRGPGELGFRLASPDGYRMAGEFPPSRVLLVEDVFVTGARLFSAARALIDAGHAVAGTLVIARRVNREWGDCQALWDRQTGQPFTWATSPLTITADSDLLASLRAC